MSARLSSLTVSEQKFIADALAASEQVSGKPLKGPQRKSVIDRARQQIISQRLAQSAKDERALERQATPFTWNKPKPPRR